MNGSTESALQVFHEAARRVPAYRALLAEQGIVADEINTGDNFRHLPVLDKQNTFQRFPIADLCLDGTLGKPASVLTSSGHSGVFAFSLADERALAATTQAIDDVLDQLFGVRTMPTLLINCLPMGVKVPTAACTLAETSVRPDMVLALVQALGADFTQLILVGDAAFVKLVLELGVRQGIEWRRYRVHVVLGEELLAENARSYFHRLLGSEPANAETGLIFSSMGIAEIGLNLFFEAPPAAPLIALRRALHSHAELRRTIVGDATWAPSLFTFDPRCVHVEFIEGNRLVLTTLLPTRIPLVRYAPGDYGRFVTIPAAAHTGLAAVGCNPALLEALPIVAIRGRGQSALAGNTPLSPEAIKEGIYHDPESARLTTANFRLASGPECAEVRLQLSPDVVADETLDRRFAEAIGQYAEGPIRVRCQPYASFGSGMRLDYERKYDYLGP